MRCVGILGVVGCPAAQGGIERDMTGPQTLIDVGPVAMKAVRRLRREVLLGRLAPGMLLPSVRELASETGIGLVTAHKALHRAEDEGWVERQSRGRQLRVISRADRVARRFFETEPPSVAYWVIARERRIPIEFRLPGLSEGLQEEMPFSSSRYLFVDSADGVTQLEHLMVEHARQAEVGYVLVSLSAVLKRVFQQSSVPCVIVGDVGPELSAPSVYMDQRKEGLLAGRLLCRTGPVVALFGEQLIGGETHIVEGVQDAARVLGQPVPREEEFHHMLRGDVDAEQILAAVDRLLGSARRPGAVLAGRAEFAMAVLRVAAYRELRIPQDLQVMGMVHHPLFQYTHPQISSIGVPSDVELGRECARLLAQSFLCRNKSCPRVEIEPTLIERESTLPA